jgi:hypothetical protein
MTDAEVSVSLALPGAASGELRRLDDRSYVQAASNPETFRESDQVVELADGVTDVTLPPFSVATLTFVVGQA